MTVCRLQVPVAHDIRSGVSCMTLAVIMLLATACGAPDDNGKDHAVLHRGNGPDPGTLDPHRRQDETAGNVLRDVYEGLVVEGPRGDIEPGVARRWRFDEEGRRIVFELRDDARWCNGDPVTAADFIAGLRRAVDPATAAPFASLLLPLDNAAAIMAGQLPPAELGVTASGPHALELRLTAPSPWLLHVLAHSIAYPVHRESLAAYGDAFARAGHLVGNGAYCLTEARPQSYLRLDRNPHHWNAAAHSIDTVYFHTVENLDAELDRYRAGELDITVSVPPGRLRWVRENLAPDLREAPLLVSYYLGINLAEPPFRDAPALRRALNLALDREQMVAAILDAHAMPAYTLVPPMPAYEMPLPDYASWPYERRLEEARRLYREAGYSAENPLRVELLSPISSHGKRLATVIASLWRESLGANIVINQMEWKVFLSTKAAGKSPGLYRDGWTADFGDPLAFLQMFASDDVSNAYGFNSVRYDQLLARANTTEFPVERLQLLAAAERELLERDGLIPLYFDYSRHLVRPAVLGWQPHPLDHHPTRYLSIATEPSE